MLDMVDHTLTIELCLLASHLPCCDRPQANKEQTLIFSTECFEVWSNDTSNHVKHVIKLYQTLPCQGAGRPGRLKAN